MKAQKFFPLVLLILLSLTLSACGSKKPTTLARHPIAQDLANLPQNLDVYAKQAGGSRQIVSTAEQNASAAAQKAALFDPWEQTGPSARSKKALAQNFWTYGSKAYTDNKRPFPMDVWNSLLANSNKSAFGQGAGPAISVRHSNLRAMPSHMHYFLRPDRPGEGYPFDYFQQSSIPPGTPLYICNISRDGAWYLVDGPVVSGWMPAADLARVDSDFMQRWQAPSLAAVVRDKTAIGGMVGHIGTLLPLAASAGTGFDRALSVYYPKRGAGGKAEIGTANLPSGAAVAVPLPLTPDNVARVGKDMMNQPYGWGGLDQKRDCSALTRNLFAPFGIHLPRNSANQARAGRKIDLYGDSGSKEATILRQGKPFASLIWMKGHIGVYLGGYQGKPVMFHNAWGLRIRDRSGACEGRAVIGKAVVTTLKPGIERRDLCGPMIDRIRAVTILPR